MGMDGWLYVSIGDKGIPKMTRKEKDQGSVHVAEGRWRHTKEGHHISLEGGGVIRFRPDGSGLEVFASGTRNHLDVPMDEHDRIFVRDNTDDGDGWNTRLHVPAARRLHGLSVGVHAAAEGDAADDPRLRRRLARAAAGSTATTACRRRIAAASSTANGARARCGRCKVAPDGAGFKYVDQIAFMDPAGTGVKDFRPFTLRPTADGRGFYVTDWGFSGWLQKVKAAGSGR